MTRNFCLLGGGIIDIVFIILHKKTSSNNTLHANLENEKWCWHADPFIFSRKAGISSNTRSSHKTSFPFKKVQNVHNIVFLDTGYVTVIFLHHISITSVYGKDIELKEIHSLQRRSRWINSVFNEREIRSNFSYDKNRSRSHHHTLVLWNNI